MPSPANELFKFSPPEGADDTLSSDMPSHSFRFTANKYRVTYFSIATELLGRIDVNVFTFNYEL